MVKKNEKIAREARIAYEKWCAWFKPNIDNYHRMHTFVLGQQWTDEEEDDMIKTYRKKAMTSNKLGTMANSLLGEQQQNTPQLQVVPMSGCNAEVASVREAITKDIMFSSDANTAYQMAAMQAGIGGFGAFALDTDYTHQKSFDLDPKYLYFKDSTRCFWDIGAEKKSKTDGTRCGYLSRMSRPLLREEYGKEVEEDILSSANITQTKEEIALAVQPNESENPFTWADDEAVTIIDYFVRRYEKDTLYKLSNGVVLNQEEMDELIAKSKEINGRVIEGDIYGNEPMPQMGLEEETEEEPTGFGVKGEHDILPSPYGVEPENPKKKPVQVMEPLEDLDTMVLWYENEIVRIEGKRPSKKYKIIHYRIAGDYILDDSEFPSEKLPLVFVDNCSWYDKTGRQITKSFFQDCIDTQRYINYLRTQSAYILKVSRYDQWIGSKKNVSSLDTQRNWRDPTAIQGMLTYDESQAGNKPEQIRPPELSQSLFQQYQLAIEDLYTSTGLYPARMGNMGNSGGEASGKALDRWQRQGSYSTYVFYNSINNAIAAGGEVLNEMIPRVYDTERVLTLTMPDKGIQNVTINKQADEYGERIDNDIRKGTYQVRLKPGPSYEGQKEQALESLQDVLKADPTSFPLIADLYAENLPLANTLEIKNRLKTRVPPQIIEAGKTGQMPPQNNQPSPEQQAMQMDAQFKQAQIQIKQQELMLKQKQMEADIEIERMKLEIAQLELAGNVEEQRMRYLAETDRTASDNAIAHADNLVKILTHKVDNKGNV